MKNRVRQGQLLEMNFRHDLRHWSNFMIFACKYYVVCMALFALKVSCLVHVLASTNSEKKKMRDYKNNFLFIYLMFMFYNATVQF